MQWETAANGKTGESGDVIDDTMREIGCGTDKEDGVAVDETRYCFDGDAVGRCRAGDLVEFDVEIIGCFVESCVCGIRYNPDRMSVKGSRVIEQP